MQVEVQKVSLHVDEQILTENVRCHTCNIHSNMLGMGKITTKLGNDCDKGSEGRVFGYGFDSHKVHYLIIYGAR